METTLKEFNLDFPKLRKKFVQFAAVTGGLTVLIPFAITFFLRKDHNLGPDSFLREIFRHPPVTIYFNVYVFNVTNPEEVATGGKPILKEIGPYVFIEDREKYNLEDNEEADSLTFNINITNNFQPNLSYPLTGKEKIIIPHPVLVGALVQTHRDKPDIVDFVSAGLKEVFHNPESIMFTTTAAELLWDGFIINCDVKDFAARTVCGALREESPVKVIDQYNMKLSLLSIREISDVSTFTVNRGIKNRKEINQMMLVDGKDRIEIYDVDKCNIVKGSEGSFYAPKIKKKKWLEMYVPELCRSFNLFPVKNEFTSIITTMRMELNLTNEDEFGKPESCYCREYPKHCPREGTWDLSMCIQSPIILSKPHYLDADSKLLNLVEGLSPNRESHDSYVNIYRYLGAPVALSVKLQANLEIEHIPNAPLLANIPNTVIPLVWFEEKVDVDGRILFYLQLVFNLKKIAIVMRVLFIFIGCGGIIGVTLMMQKSTVRKPAQTQRMETVSGRIPSPEVEYVIQCHPPMKPEENSDPMVEVLNRINSDMSGNQLQRTFVAKND